MNPDIRSGFRAAASATAIFSASAFASAQSIELISRTTGGAPSTGNCSGAPFVSADGRFVAFTTNATDLGPGNAGVDAYVLDRITGVLELASPDTGGQFPGAAGELGGISDDGRWAIYSGNELGPWDDGEFGGDILGRDLLLDTTIEVTSAEFQATPHSNWCITNDGLKRAFHTFNDWFGSIYTQITIRDQDNAVVGTRSGHAQFTSDPSNTWVEHPILSGDGRYLVYLHRDMAGTTVRRCGYGMTGTPEDILASSTVAAGHVDPAGVSRDGRFVVYVRRTGADFSAWVHDMQTATEERVDPTSGPALAAASFVGGITDDGRYVVFSSASPDLVAGDTNGVADVFVRDTLLDATSRVSVDALGAQANGASTRCGIDAAGASVVFLSTASNLVPGDTNGNADVFLRSACVAATAFCFGDGSGFACPCGNAGAAGNGCASSVNSDGARLGTVGCASLSADTLVLGGSGMSDSAALYFQGTVQVGGGSGAAFGDGLRCVGGIVSRLGTKQNVAGSSQYPAAGDAPISQRGSVTSPGVRHYQCWYRNAAAFCTSATFNLTNAIAASWIP
jgi:Tol biopolymer transport system component